MSKNPGEIYLGISGSEVLLPDASRKVKPIINEIVRTNRTVSGKLVEDIVRKYTNYQIDYETMLGSDREILLSLYNLGKYLNLIYVNQDGTTDTQTVKMTLTDGERDLCGSDEWIWSSVSVLLEVV